MQEQEVDYAKEMENAQEQPKENDTPDLNVKFTDGKGNELTNTGNEPEATPPVAESQKQETEDTPQDPAPQEPQGSEEQPSDDGLTTIEFDQPEDVAPAGIASVDKVEETPKDTPTQIDLPEGIDKLVDFINGGGTLEDYVNLNKDFSKFSDDEVLVSFYKDNPEYSEFTNQEILDEINDKFDVSDLDEEDKEYRTAMRNKKREVAKARQHLVGKKNEHFTQLKPAQRNDVSEEHKSALDFVNEQKEFNNKLYEESNKVFSEGFEGFTFDTGDGKFMLKLNNASNLSKQSASSLSEEFVREDGGFDVEGYHKALFAAKNADKIAKHFYLQGQADAIKQSAKRTKNVDMQPKASQPDQTQRQTVKFHPPKHGF